MIYPAVHYTMGGLWVDYNLMSNVPGLHVLGEANFSDHGANRLGASALMQGLADGYFVIPTTIANYLVTQKPGSITTDMPEFKQAEDEVRERINKLLLHPGQAHRGFLPPRTRHDDVGQLRHGPLPRGPRPTRLQKIPQIREEFWQNVRIPGIRRERQHGTRKGRPRRRLPRIRRNHVLRRPRPRGILRRPLPRRAPVHRGRSRSPGRQDPARRGQAPRREFLPRFLLGIQGRGQRSPSSTRSRSSTKPSRHPSAATRNRVWGRAFHAHEARQPGFAPIRQGFRQAMAPLVR